MLDRRELSKESWQSFFDDLSRRLDGRVGELEIGQSGSGSQTENLSTLQGISYEPHIDRVEIFMDNLGHSVNHPARVLLFGGDDLPTCIEILDQENVTHRIDVRANDDAYYRGDETRRVG